MWGKLCTTKLNLNSWQKTPIVLKLVMQLLPQKEVSSCQIKNWSRTQFEHATDKEIKNFGIPTNLNGNYYNWFCLLSNMILVKIEVFEYCQEKLILPPALGLTRSDKKYLPHWVGKLTLSLIWNQLSEYKHPNINPFSSNSIVTKQILQKPKKSKAN